MHRQKHMRSYSFIICFVLVLNLVLCVAPVYAVGETIVLNGPEKSEVQTFTVDNMFPGDKISKDYVLNISHKENIEVMFKAEVLADSEKLAEVLKLKG